MKILVISQYYFPEQFMITNIAEKLATQGNEVTVLTGIPNYPMGKIIGDYKNRFTNEIINDVNVIRVSMLLRGKGLRLILNYFSYAVMACLRVLFLKEKYDKVFVFEVSPVTQIFPAYIYKKFKNKNTEIYVNCQDIWPEVLKSNGFEDDSLIFKIGYKLSRYLYSKADKILISSILFKKYLTEDLKLTNEKIKYIPNYASDWVLDVESIEKEKIHLLFAGNLGKAQNLDLIIDAIALSKEKDKYIFDFVGNGSEMKRVQSKAQSKNLDNVIFHGRKSGKELKYYYDLADAFVLTLICENKICYTVPSKLQGYMGAGKPILSSILGGAKEMIEKSNSGVVVPYNDANQLAKLFDDFTLNQSKYKELGNNGRKYFKENFTESHFINQLLTYLKEGKYESI